MLALRDAVPVAEAASRLGVPADKLRALTRAGDVHAPRRAGRWFVPVAELRRLEGLPRPDGRPYTATSAWALLGLLAGQHPAGLSPQRLSQLRRQLRQADAAELAGRLRHRARRQLAFVHPSQLPHLQADPRVVRSGWREAGSTDTPLLPADDVPADLYLAVCDLAALRERYLVADADEVANVVLRTVDDTVVVPSADGVAAPPVVALDLLETGDPRAVDAGLQLFGRLVQAHRER